MIEQIKNKIQNVLLDIQNIRQECKEKNLLNEQFYIEFEDKLNAISIMDPNS